MRGHLRLKAIICVVALTASTLLAPLYAFAAVDTASGALSSPLAPKNVMVSVKDADVRDVLSAIAMNMGYNIVYTGPATTISIDLDNISPAAAFDYILKILDLTYLQEGSTYIVGDRGTLQDNFSSSLALSRFNLQYVSPTIISDMISRLRLPVTVITLQTNTNTLWVQGFPADIAKVRELVNVMDIVENSEVPTAMQEGVNGKSLTPIKLNHLTSYEFRLLLQALQIDFSVSLLDDGNRIYVYATPEELETVIGIKDVVDQKNTYFDESEIGNGFAVLTAKDKVSKQTAISAISAICPGLQIVSADNRSTAFVVMGASAEIDRAQDLLRKLDDKAYDLDTTYFTYELKNITAAEAERRLKEVTFGDKVVWYVTTHPDFSGTIFVYCNEDYQEQVWNLVASLDMEDATLAEYAGISAIPIYAIRNDDPTTRAKFANGMESYLRVMLGGIIQSGSIKRLEAENMTVLYLDSGFSNFNAETIELIRAMVSRLSEVAVDEKSDATQLTFAVFWKETNQPGPVPAQPTPQQLQAYAEWLISKIGMGSTAAAASFSVDGSIYSPSSSGTDEPPQPEDPIPVSADEEAFNTAKIALDWLFYNGGIASSINSETTADTVLAAAVSATDGIPDVVLRFNPASPPSHVKPTETEKGSLTVSIILEVGGYWEGYDIELVLPVIRGGE